MTAIQTHAAYLTSLDEIVSGRYYRFYSLAHGMTTAMSETTTGSNNVFCDTPNENDYMQVWYVEVSSTSSNALSVQLRNAVSGRWIDRSGNLIQTYINPSSTPFTMALTDDGFTIARGNGLHHQQSGHDVVSWDISSPASKWQIEEVTVDQTALDAQKEDYNGYVNLVNNKASITTKLSEFFTTAACSELKPAYASYSDDDLTGAMADNSLPQVVIDMALKVKNGDWEEYMDGWNHNERTFRIASYKPVSMESRWRNIVKVGYALSPNSDPTGIYVKAGDIITVYVNNLSASATAQLRNVPHQSAIGDAYTLTQGFNILKMQTEGCLFVDYEVDNTTNGGAPYISMDNFSAATIHIEGGLVNGAFSATRGDTDEDWSIMKEHLFKHYDYLQLRSRKKIFNMRADYVIAACPTNMIGLLSEWDNVVEMEHNIMGLDAEFGNCFNTPMMAVSFTGSGHMYASSYGTYYNETTLSDVMRYENLFAGGSLWGPAHEIGHINQAAINIIGQSEVSNNVFSNIAVYLNGHLTSRAEYISTTFQNMADNIYWQERGIWERTHLYFQLYQFFHIQGYYPTFYQEFFKALRADPCTRVKNTFIDATDDYLKFYKKACEVSGYDLTELFQAYGFFIVPKQTSYTLGDVTKDAFQVGDYGTFYLVVTQAMIDEAINYVKSIEGIKKANIVFIEDRVSAPDATYQGVLPGTKKTAFGGYPIGKGDVGQYTDFVSTTSAAGYKASYVEDTNGDLDVLINHQNGTGAVGFKVYDANNNLVYLSNTYEFSVPAAIYGNMTKPFKIVAAGPDGDDQVLDVDNNFIEWVVTVKDENNKDQVLKKHFQIVHDGQEITAYPKEIDINYMTLPAFTPFTYHSTDTQKEYDVQASIATPFKSSTDAKAYYYNVRVRNGYLCQSTSEGTSVPALIHSNSATPGQDAYRWAFYGNPYDGYRLKNKVTGQWLCAGASLVNGQNPILSLVDSTIWKVDTLKPKSANAAEFCLYVQGTTRYLNDYGGHGTNIAFYGSGSTTTVSDEQSVTMPTVTVNATSHLSSFSYPSPLVVPEDVNIFIATATYDNTLTVQWIDTKVVPANTGVLLYSDGGGEKILSLGAWVDTGVTELYEGNILKSTASGGFTVQDAQNIYALYAGQVSFAKVKTGVQIPSNKAYLDLSASSSRLLNIDFGGAVTGISNLIPPPSLADDDAVDAPLYNINGQRVSRFYKGIVIRHGLKKVQR